MSTERLEDTYGLTPMQQGMLFQYQLDPGSGVYVQQMLCSLREELTVPAFRKAWEQIVMRHPILRTSYRWEGLDKPLQDVHATASLPFEEHDWRALSSSAQKSRFEEFLKRDRQRGFDLARPPLMRVTLFRMADAEYELVWTNHHIIADGHSRSVLLKELFALYDANCHGRDLDLQLEQPRPFREHVEWLQQRAASASASFWRQLLKGFTAHTAVDAIPKSEKWRDGDKAHAGQQIRIAESVTARLKALAEQHQLTLNAMVQGVWALLLSRYTGEDDVVIGAVRAGRHTVEGAGSIVGLFINTVPVRVRIPSDENLISWLQALRDQHIAVREHEHTPLVEVIGCSDVRRGMPLFESLVVFDYAFLNSRLRAQGGSWKDREFRLVEETGFPLTLYGYGEAQLSLKISYDRRRFDDANIGRMLRHLKTLLEGMAEDLDRPLGTLPMLTEAERHQVLVEWNDTWVDYPRDVCLHQLFEMQVERTPDAVAVSFKGENLTYQAFNQRANQLARRLQRLGVGPEVLVGVYMERSIEMVVALYGILKAGGAYVPLDPEYPPDRVAFMLEDTQVPVLLTQERLVSSLPAHNAQVICLDSEWATIAKEPVNNLTGAAAAANLAYVIYTSGSTGRPKGVMNTHRGICNRLLWMQDAYQLTGADRIMQKTPFSFDVSVWEFFWPLLVGARLIVARPGGHKDGDYLARLIVEQEITTIHFVPSMLQVFLRSKGVEECRSLKRVICSGEALPHDLQERFFARLDAELHNLYGPTEAAVDVSYWPCQRESDLRIVPIGRPVANTQLYVLGSYMQPLPIGVAGELHIGGVQVARGYLNRSELTAEKFVPDPFRDEPEARLYKTGDLVRFLPDGSIDFLGRLDHQVKLRGFRIELGEIESVLSQHPTVHETVVLAREDVPGDKRLVAYVVPASPSLLRFSELRDALKSQLPEYMVPSAFVRLEALPLTPNGKVDRRNLPPPEGERQSTEAYVAPQKELEKTIARIWQELLQVERVGVNDSFFDLGGHSLLLVQAHSRLSEIVDKNLSVTDMFRYPTVRTLSLYLGQDSGEGDQSTGQDSRDRARVRREAMLQRRQRRQKLNREIS